MNHLHLGRTQTELPMRDASYLSMSEETSLGARLLIRALVQSLDIDEREWRTSAAAVEKSGDEWFLSIPEAGANPSMWLRLAVKGIPINGMFLAPFLEAIATTPYLICFHRKP